MICTWSLLHITSLWRYAHDHYYISRAYENMHMIITTYHKLKKICTWSILHITSLGRYACDHNYKSQAYDFFYPYWLWHFWVNINDSFILLHSIWHRWNLIQDSIIESLRDMRYQVYTVSDTCGTWYRIASLKAWKIKRYKVYTVSDTGGTQYRIAS